MGKLAILASLLWIAKAYIFEPLFPPTRLWLQILYDLVLLLLFLPLTYFSWRLFRRLQKNFLWKIRRRLILSHVFVALIPLFVLISIVLLSMLLIYYQLTYYLVLNQLGVHIGQVKAYTLALREGIEQMLQSSSANPSQLQLYLNRDAQFIQAVFPQASIHLKISNARNAESETFHSGFSEKFQQENYHIPDWLKSNDYSGLVFDPLDISPLLKEGLLRKKRPPWSNLSMRAIAFSNAPPDIRFSVEVSVPLDRFMLRKLKSALGVDFYLTKPGGEGSVMESGLGLIPDNIIAATEESYLNNPQGFQAMPLPMWLYPILWETGEDSPPNKVDELRVELSLTRLYQNLFLSESNLSKLISNWLKYLLFFFLGIEAISVLIATLLTKTITNAVDSLDKGTQLIKRGDFNHRIIVKSNDQLGSLAESFNRMIESVQGLLAERVEKERMERELEIAKDVQLQLFPRQSPAFRGLEISGMCLPARTVSGDYYDYLTFTPDVVAVVIGDICGKGISAALLMANLQATLRTHVSRLAMDDPQTLHRMLNDNMVAGMIEQINRHIYGLTSPNKFASLFSAVFDRSLAQMTYCNAGHNPPILLKAGRPFQLKTGGTVVGIFSEATYRQESIALGPGDLLMAYTDGIVEAVNEYGDEFGEEQLQQLLVRHSEESVDDIQRRVIDSVVEWSYGRERDDDMTLVVTRVRPDWVRD